MAAKKIQFSEICEQLMSSDWDQQIKGINNLQLNYENFIVQINSDPYLIFQPLLDCSASIRTSLAKHSLECIKTLIKNEFINIINIADSMLSTLLTVVSNGKKFVADLAGDCASLVCQRIPAQRAAKILITITKKKQEKTRAKATLCLSEIITKCTNYTPIVQTLSSLLNDASLNVRQNARECLIKLSSKSNFRDIISSSLLDKSLESEIFNQLSDNPDSYLIV